MELHYDLSKARAMLSEVSRLENFNDVRTWDAEAEKEIVAIDSTLAEVRSNKASLADRLQESSDSHAQQSLLKRMFSSDVASKRIQKEIDGLVRIESALEACRGELDEWVHMTPDDEDEAKVMVKELKLLKKDLMVQKSEIKSQIKQINTDARVANARISNQVFFSNGRMRRLQKITVREQKENALKPHEQAIFSLDARVLDVDKKIAWIEKIKFRG